MKKVVKKIICLVLAAVLLNCSFVMNAFAAENEDPNIVTLEASVVGYNDLPTIGMRSTTFTDTMIIISPSSAGMGVTINTGMNDTASVVGVKDIEIKLKEGNKWTKVAVSSGGEVSGYSGCSVSFTYPDAKKGSTYKICCTHYGNVDEYRELYHETDEFVFTY